MGYLLKKILDELKKTNKQLKGIRELLAHREELEEEETEESDTYKTL